MLVEIDRIKSMLSSSLLIAGGPAGFENSVEGVRRKTVQCKSGVFEGGSGDGWNLLPSSEPTRIVVAEMLAPLLIGGIVLILEAEDLQRQRVEV